MLKQIVAIAFIFCCASVAWIILGGTVQTRTSHLDKTARLAVGDLWGGPQVQHAPLAHLVETVEESVDRTTDGRTTTETVHRERLTPLALSSSDVDVDLRLDHRRKGLLWYPTYRVGYGSVYSVRNPLDREAVVRLSYAFPAGAQILDDFRFTLDNGTTESGVENGEVVHVVTIPAGEEVRFEIAYRSQGVGTWRYAFGEHVQEVRDFRLAITTDFDAVDFPPGTLSPGRMERADGGRHLEWSYSRLVADAGIGVEMPERLNPGPWVSRVTFFAPVSLFLFFFLMFVVGIIREVRLHPMHYFFLAAAFFAFHLLLAYLVDHVSVHLAVALASATSVALVISYMRLVVSSRFAFVEVGLAQLIYLVGFAYTFFLDGYTGLAVTVMTIATLFVVMQATARLDWTAVFRTDVSRTDRGAAPVAATA
jgi:hypothetical protein